MIRRPIWTNMAVMMVRTVNNRRSQEEVEGKERQEEQKLQHDEVRPEHS